MRAICKSSGTQSAPSLSFDVHLVPVTYASWMSEDIVGEEVFCLCNTEPYGKYAKHD